MRPFSCFAICAIVSAHAAGQCAFTPGLPGSASLYEGAGIGAAVAMSADGSVALVGVPGYDLGDGEVRTFTRSGDTWTEGERLLAPPQFRFGCQFGQALAMDDAGDTAIISAPRDVNSPGFAIGAGAVYIVERTTGTWAIAHRLTSPVPGGEHNFGASVAISPDGDTVVIGQANVLGTEWQNRPDGAWVYTREASGWSAPEPLVPTTSPDLLAQFGHAVAIAPSGDLIAVGAPGPIFGSPGFVSLFRHDGSGWVDAGRVSKPVSGQPFNLFGSVVAFDQQTLLVVNPAADEPSGPPTSTSPVYVFEPDAGTYPSSPELLFPPPGLSGGARITGPIATRGGPILVGASEQYFYLGGGLRLGAAFRLERTPDGWRFTDRIVADEPDPDGSDSLFGAAVAVSADGVRTLIGEPAYGEAIGTYQQGRVHFPPTDRVEETTRLAVDEGASLGSLEISFPGLPTSFLSMSVLGDLFIRWNETCAGDFGLAQVVGAQLVATEPSYTVDGPGGIPIVVSGVEISVTGASDPFAPDASSTTVTGLRMRLAGNIKIGLLPAMPMATEEIIDPAVITLTGGIGAPMQVSMPNFTTTRTLNIGLGANNPTVTLFGSLDATEPSALCAADIAAEFGVANIDDVLTFLAAFSSEDPIADFAPPGGVFDIDDVLAFLNAFLQCP